VITLLGTAHVVDLRERLRAEIRTRRPAVVALELDPPRLAGLLNPQRSGKAPAVYRLLASFQRRLAAERGIEPGSEMKAAYEIAREIGSGVALIDVDVRQTFARLWAQMPWGERARFFLAALAGLLPGRADLDRQIEQVSADYASFFESLGAQFPTVKRVLIDERNEHMAKALADLSAGGLDVVAVIGDGHVDGVAAILSGRGVAVEQLRLRELRGEIATSSAGFSVTVESPNGKAPPGNA